MESARAALNNAVGRLEAISRVHRQLAQKGPEYEVDLDAFLDSFCADVLQSIGAIVEVRANDVRLRADVASQICIFLNELAMNSVKHGGRDGKPVILTVDVTAMPGNQLRFVISDNGSGLPPDFDLDHASGLGMIIVTSTVGKLGGTIRTTESVGAGFEIMLPLKPAGATSGA
ncbi:MAG: sensor histidine kinase [Rhodobacterales bacterium]|nr:sensor histidine kinase [Rhodobacterales bacterium]